MLTRLIFREIMEFRLHSMSPTLAPILMMSPFLVLGQTFTHPGGNDGDHHERPKDHQAQPKEDPIKLQEVKEVEKLYRKFLFLPEELVPDSYLRKVIFVTTFGQAQVDPQLEGPYAFEA